MGNRENQNLRFALLLEILFSYRPISGIDENPLHGFHNDMMVL